MTITIACCATCEPMLALVYTDTGRLEIEARPEPVPGPNEVIVDVGLVGICGSDLLGYLGRSPGRRPPLVLGHEFTAWLDGKPVAVNPIVSCGKCEACRAGRENLCPQLRLMGLHHDGAMRERLNVPRANIVPLRDSDQLELMILAEPFACALHATGMTTEPHVGRSLIVGFGCLGAMIAAALGWRGVERIDVTDPAPARRALAARFKARALEASEIPCGVYSYVYDCAGYASTRTLGVRALRPGGHLVLVGYGEAEGGINFTEVVRREYQIHGVMAYPAADYRQAVELLQGGLVNGLDLVRVFPLTEGQHAFDEARTVKSDIIKTALAVLLKPK
jgi:2-desacetyl-2-hydroxyethyl bacteriochlorophyllide A dehydrogenase